MDGWEVLRCLGAFISATTFIREITLLLQIRQFARLRSPHDGSTIRKKSMMVRTTQALKGWVNMAKCVFLSARFKVPSRQGVVAPASGNIDRRANGRYMTNWSYGAMEQLIESPPSLGTSVRLCRSGRLLVLWSTTCNLDKLLDQL